MKEEIKNLLTNLSQKERSIIVSLFGLDGCPRSPEEIGTLFGVEKDVILQIADDVEKRYPELMALAKEEHLFCKNCTDVVRWIAGDDIYVSVNASIGLINEVLSESSERDKNIIILKFGLKDGNIKTLKEVGELNGITSEWVRQIERKTITAIQSKIRKAIQLQKEYIKKPDLSNIDSELLKITFAENEQKHMLMSYPVKIRPKDSAKRPQEILDEIEKMFAENSEK